MKTTVLVFVDRENTSMGMRIASQEKFTQILIKNKELPLQERRLFTKDVIADTDGLDVMYIETGLPEYQKWNSKQTYRNKIQNEKRKYTLPQYSYQSVLNQLAATPRFSAFPLLVIAP